jgi:hypothetical protein
VFQQLASDIQAMLVQAQSGTSTAAPSTEQQLGADVQALVARLQDNQTGNGQTTQSATATQAQPHHHHHHHHEAGSATSASASSTSTGSESSTDQTVSQAMAADIAQALQAYGSSPPTSTAAVLTA